MGEVKQFSCGAPLLGDILKYFGKADESVSFITNGADNHICPEFSAILSNVACLGFKTPVALSDLQRLRRCSGCLIGRRIELRKISADDFFSAISFDTLGAGVPA